MILLGPGNLGYAPWGLENIVLGANIEFARPSYDSFLSPLGVCVTASLLTVEDVETSDVGAQSLSSFFEVSTAAVHQLMARPGNNLGNPTLIFSVPLSEFFRMSIIANDPTVGEVAQRRLDPAHAFKLAQFMLKGLVNAARRANNIRPQIDDQAFERVLHRMSPQPYTAMQPLVVNIRTAGPNGSKLTAKQFPDSGPAMGVTVFLGQRDLLYVIDGQHRRMGIETVLDFLEEVRQTRMYPKLKASLFPYEGERDVPAEDLAIWEKAYEVSRTVCTVAAEAHLGLDIEQERQLFHDLNNKTKKVEVSLALEFDSSNPVNQYIKQSLLESGMIRLATGDKIDWNSADTGAMTRKDLVAVNAHLFLNKSNINGATAVDVDQRQDVARRFWEAVIQCDGFGEENAREVTVLAQPVMLKALAKLSYDFAFGRARQRSEEHLNTLLDNMTNIDFSHENPVWRYYEMNEDERRQNGVDALSSYLPTASGNRDIGAFDELTGKMRFGAKHNDIFPILGDMVRYSLGLPSRHAEPLVTPE